MRWRTERRDEQAVITPRIGSDHGGGGKSADAVGFKPFLLSGVIIIGAGFFRDFERFHAVLVSRCRPEFVSGYVCFYRMML